MTANTHLRRLLVTLGITGSLVAAGLTIRAASLWAAADAPLSIAPVSVTSVQNALDQERARTASLEAQLATLGSSSGDLNAALEAARQQVVTDRTTADELRTSLAAAQQKLATLEAALGAAARRRASTGGGGTGASGGSGGGEDGGGHDD
jgi:septal ring factor EnvC (AmiA/AmiB activator)